MRINLDLSDVRSLERWLQRVNGRALPYASRATVNGMAFYARQEYQAGIRAQLTNRNQFTERSVRVEQSRTLNVRRQEAITGSVADYMQDQEFGSIQRKRGKEGKPIPTAYAAGQSEKGPRTRLPRRPNRIARIQLRKRFTGIKGRQARNAAAVQDASQGGGSKYVFLDLGRRKGIFKVTGGRRRPKVRMVQDLTRQSVSIPAAHLLRDATRRTERKGPEIAVRALEFQLRRLGELR